ncbi:hypothetical protein P9281_27445 [Caballeronia sp. LP003]|uniref:hypothetical protein n=1 Tax=Caballeronia sp. LP003 TaxID=3038551 RepID=UPI00285BA974|nr:hypothetical protein [Caballeronia sp. LP003]MDR5790285.1 hypothetical protein [Caballeronia sp. LP003]
MRDVTKIPDELLSVIARAIRLHVKSYCASFAARLDALEKAEAREPVVNVTSFPVKDHTETIDSLRRVQEAHDRRAVEDRRELDRLLRNFDSVIERMKSLETREPVAPVTNIKDHSDAIEGLRRAREAHDHQAAEDRRVLDRLQSSFDALGDRVKALETREMPLPRDGIDGRDAFEIDVLPVIDFARDYPRGTLAQHQGGIWRAHANTRGEHGWSCVVDGIARTFVAMDSERSFTLHIERASGAHETATFALPVMIYRGVYHTGETYRCGDVVTWAGSLWHCNATTDTKPDAGGDAWTLAAKRGRDGKDAPMRVVGGTAA